MMAHWSEKASGDNYSDVKLATFDVISYSAVRPEMRRLFLPGKEGMCIIFQMREARIFCVREFYLLPEEEKTHLDFQTFKDQGRSDWMKGSTNEEMTDNLQNIMSHPFDTISHHSIKNKVNIHTVLRG